MRVTVQFLAAACALGLAGLAFPSACAAQAAVPISREADHHLVLENAYVRAYEVEVPPHSATLLHQHDRDYVYVVMGDADITNAVAGKDPVKLHLPDTTVNFSPGPFAHIARNDGGTVFRNVTISLLRPQGEVRRFFPSVRAALEGDRKETTVLETDEVRVAAVRIARGGVWSPAENGHPHLAVLLNRSQGRREPRDRQMTKFPSGRVLWLDAGEPRAIRNRAPKDVSILVLEFEDSTRAR